MRKSRWAAALGSVGVLALLYAPEPLLPVGNLWPSIGAALHGLLYAGVAWIVGRNLSVRCRGWPLLFGIMAFSGAVEWLQPCVGRSAELEDWLYGIGGAGCICATWNLARKGRVRWIAVLGLCLLPLGWEMARVRMEIRAFPVLADSGSKWSRRGWALNFVKIASMDQTGFRVEATARSKQASQNSHPGLFRAPACPDWRRVRSLRAEIYWPMAAPVIFAMRVDDRTDNPPYAERFQREFSVTQGWNRIQIPSEELGVTSGGRRLELDAIQRWGVFLVSDTPLDYFLLGTVRLELQPEDQ